METQQLLITKQAHGMNNTKAYKNVVKNQRKAEDLFLIQNSTKLNLSRRIPAKMISSVRLSVEWILVLFIINLYIYRANFIINKFRKL